MCSVTVGQPLRMRRGRTIGLSDVLRPDEVTTSNILVDRLEGRGLLRNYARQILARDSESHQIWRSEHLVLASGARMYCWRAFWGKPDFHKQVERILGEERRGLHRLYVATRNSVALRPTIEKLLASPLTLRASQRYPLVQDEVEALIDLGAVRWEGVGTTLERLVDFRLFESILSARHARHEWAQRAVASRITRIVADHLRRSNFLTWGSIPPLESDNGLVPFNNLPFDHVGFSRLAPLLRFSKKSHLPAPTPVAFDMHAKACQLYDVEGFLDRLQRAGMNKTSRLPILGVIAAPEFEKGAWTRAKNAGLMTINLRTMFGEPALAAMAAVEELLSRLGVPPERPSQKNAVGYHEDETERIEEEHVRVLVDALGGVTGSPIVSELRGLGFEVLVGLILSQEGWQTIELNRRYRFDDPDDPDASRELDVLGSRKGGQELVAVECKAEHSKKELSPSYLRRFFCETVPAMVREKSKSCVPDSVIAEIWTSGLVGEDAKHRLAELKLPKNFKVALRDGKDIRGFIPRNLPAALKLLATIGAPPSEIGEE